jgi:hypothetical protein
MVNGRDELDLKELSFLLGDSTTQLRTNLNRAMALLRSGTLKEKLIEISDAPPEPTSSSVETCVVCNRVIEDPYYEEEDFVYCSEFCYGAKPPEDVFIEREFNLPLSRILEICVNNFTTVRTMSHALQMTPSNFQGLCHRYGIDLSDII